MTTKITKIITAAVIAFGAFFAVGTTPALADNSAICDNSNVPPEVKKASGCPGATDDNLPGIIQAILNSIILILGTVAVIYIVIGGVTYMTSTGDANKVKKAKDTILYATIGLVICALAATIVNFTINIINSNNSSQTTEDSSSDGTGSGSGSGSSSGSSDNDNTPNANTPTPVSI